MQCILEWIAQYMRDNVYHDGMDANAVNQAIQASTNTALQNAQNAYNQMPAAPGTRAWPPSLPSIPTSRATVLT